VVEIFEFFLELQQSTSAQNQDANKLNIRSI